MCNLNALPWESRSSTCQALHQILNSADHVIKKRENLHNLRKLVFRVDCSRVFRERQANVIKSVNLYAEHKFRVIHFSFICTRSARHRPLRNHARIFNEMFWRSLSNRRNFAGNKKTCEISQTVNNGNMRKRRWGGDKLDVKSVSEKLLNFKIPFRAKVLNCADRCLTSNRPPARLSLNKLTRFNLVQFTFFL